MSSNESIWAEINLNKDKWGKRIHPLYGEGKPSLPSEALIYIKGKLKSRLQIMINLNKTFTSDA